MSSQGERVVLIEQPGGFQRLTAGQYGKWKDGTWYACTPNDHGANLSAHDVVEHDDGTITVTPSILVSNNKDGALWHGYLTRGVWREC
jgi:hypothetical protein